MGIGIAGLDACIISKFPPVVRGEFSVKGTPQKLVVFFRSQIHSYAYYLVSVRRHNQHVRSPIQGFSRCEGISFIPRVKQRSTFPRLSPQERKNYITSPRPASIAALAQTGILPRQFSVSPEGNGNVGIPSGCQSVYRDAQVGIPGWGVSVYRP